jgi:DNA-directed RNA polymerase specialized sigma subunit
MTMKTTMLNPQTIAIPGQDQIQYGRQDRETRPSDGYLLREILDCLSDLPENHRLGLVLRRFHRLDYDEIASYLNISEQATRRNVDHEFRELRRQFADWRGAGIRDRLIHDKLNCLSKSGSVLSRGLVFFAL